MAVVEAGEAEVGLEVAEEAKEMTGCSYYNAKRIGTIGKEETRNLTPLVSDDETSSLQQSLVTTYLLL